MWLGGSFSLGSQTYKVVLELVSRCQDNVIGWQLLTWLSDLQGCVRIGQQVQWKVKVQQVQWKVKVYTAISFKTHLGRFFKQNKYQSCILLVFVHTFKNSINDFVGRCANSNTKTRRKYMYSIKFIGIYQMQPGKPMSLCMQSHRIL